MKKRSLCCVLFFSLAVTAFNFSAFAAERSVPVDIFVLVDKSLSIGESDSFSGIIEWAQEQLTGQMLVDGDWITLYQFCGTCENLLTTTISGDADRQRVKDALASIRPDGSFSDIGQALDIIRDVLDTRAGNGRYKVMLLLTDLRQEGAWTSRYPGVIDPFTSPYLDGARMVNHGGWYEITLDMDIQETAAALSEELYSEIAVQGSAARQAIPESGEIAVQGQ